MAASMGSAEIAAVPPSAPLAPAAAEREGEAAASEVADGEPVAGGGAGVAAGEGAEGGGAAAAAVAPASVVASTEDAYEEK